MRSLFKDLKNLPKGAIYALMNEKEKKAFVVQTTALISSLTRQVHQIKEGHHYIKQLVKDQNELEFVLLEANVKRNLLPVRHTICCNMLLDEGYTLYNEISCFYYRGMIRFGRMPGSRHHEVIYVSLRSKNKEEFVVGVFERTNEVKDFVTRYYPNLHRITEVVYSPNSLTREWYKQGE